MPSFDELNAEWEQVRRELPDALGLRMRRALSWLGRAEQEREIDHDAAFIFYWIAFNAAYGKAVSRDPTHRPRRDQFAGYFRTILSLDAHNTVYDAIWRDVLRPHPAPPREPLRVPSVLGAPCRTGLRQLEVHVRAERAARQ